MYLDNQRWCMSRVHKLGDVKTDEDGNYKVLISSSETTETWKFVLRNNRVVLIHGRSGAQCGTLFGEARTLAEGLLLEAARKEREILAANRKKKEVVVQISSRRKDKTWHNKYGIAGTD